MRLGHQCADVIPSGAVVGSVVGVQTYIFDVFGPAVIHAGTRRYWARPMKILVDQRLAAQPDSGFEIMSAGEAELNPDQPEEVFAIEATSGNTGIGLALVCAAKGYPLVVTMAAIGRRKLLRMLGAKVVLTPASEKGTGMLAKAPRWPRPRPLTRATTARWPPCWPRSAKPWRPPPWAMPMASCRNGCIRAVPPPPSG